MHDLARKVRESEQVGGRGGAAPAPGRTTQIERLPSDLQQTFEASTGADLSGVRVHQGEAPAAAADAMGARAYTSGQDIFFGAGQYGTGDRYGLHLLAHEVAHTVQQQGGGARVQAKKTDGAAGDADEAAADHAADAMVGDAEKAKKRDGALFVDFDKDGRWDAAAVLEHVAKQGPIPDDLRAAIAKGPRATATWCVPVRDRVSAAGADPSKKEKCEQLASTLTNLITELVYATPQSPLTYGQLGELARAAIDYPAGGAVAAAPPAKDPGTPGQQPVDGVQAAAEAFATKLASQGGRVPDGSDDAIRSKLTYKDDDEHPGDESGDAKLAGWTFRHDPFDNTVVARRPDATDEDAGFQISFQVGKDGAATLLRTIVISKLRAAALRRQEKMAPIEMQETEAGKNQRLQNDKDWTARDRKYDTDHEAWVQGGKEGAEPVKPQGYLGVTHTTTDCTETPGDVYHAAGGDVRDGFPFTPPTDWKSFRTLDKNPDGPKPGDVYWLKEGGAGAHMGVFKSAAPIEGQEDLWTWVVTDGGQGNYDQIQQAQERTRGPFNKKTGVFSSSIAEAGQHAGARSLVGWVDIDAYKAEKEQGRAKK